MNFFSISQEKKGLWVSSHEENETTMAHWAKRNSSVNLTKFAIFLLNLAKILIPKNSKQTNKSINK
jgi:hypothetical protein